PHPEQLRLLVGSYLKTGPPSNEPLHTPINSDSHPRLSAFSQPGSLPSPWRSRPNR
ncbi:hypothetical protein CHARACLAT_023075, partial [Characodon lateralis]|nr:hypothetical protein [Characodon lateralis]